VLRSRLLACAVATAAALVLPAAAEAGTFGVQGSTLVFTGDATAESIAGFETSSSIRFTRFAGPQFIGGPGCDVIGDGDTVDCPKGVITSVRLDLDSGDDVAAVSTAVTLPVTFNGGAGNDGLFGGGGVDTFFGDAGNDNVISRDGRAENTVNCGADNDTAISDDADTRDSCEQVEGDADGDGVRRPADCDDTNPGIRPGAADTPDDRVDQDCSGADSTNLDVDGDGFARPQDCNDGNRAIRPGAREVRGNGVDENCDTRIEPFSGIGGRVSNVWVASGSRSVNVALSAREFPAGTRLRMRCTGGGCPFRRVSRRIRSRRRVDLHRFLGDAALARGARVELRFTRSGRIGRVLRFQFGATPGVPGVRFLCAPPGRRDRDC
jgi:Putative metal-binding motif